MSNCSHIEDLIPLFVEGDLDDHKATRVQTHLKSCASCDSTAAAYRESQSWLKAYTPPQYDPDCFADARSELVRHISSPNSRGHWALRILPAPRRLIESWVAVALIASVATAVLFWLLFARHSKTQLGDQGVTAQHEVAPEPGTPAPETPNRTLPRTGSDQENRVRAQRRSAPTGVRRRTLTARHAPIQVTRPQSATALSSSDLPGTPAWNTVSGDEMLRIEIQTSNPLVRIIWFTPKAVQLRKPVELLNTPHQGAETDETEAMDFTVQE